MIDIRALHLLDVISRKLDLIMKSTFVMQNSPGKTGPDRLHLGQVSTKWYLCNDNDCWCGGQAKIDEYEARKP